MQHYGRCLHKFGHLGSAVPTADVVPRQNLPVDRIYAWTNVAGCIGRWSLGATAGIPDPFANDNNVAP